MSPDRGKTFVGFGFGPIQSALFLYEAYCSGNFDRYVVAEVDAALVGAVRAAGGRYAINIAHPDRIETGGGRRRAPLRSGRNLTARNSCHAIAASR